jgi:hypothetical protein
MSPYCVPKVIENHAHTSLEPYNQPLSDDETDAEGIISFTQFPQ